MNQEAFLRGVVDEFEKRATSRVDPRLKPKSVEKGRFLKQFADKVMGMISGGRLSDSTIKAPMKKAANGDMWDYMARKKRGHLTKQEKARFGAKGMGKKANGDEEEENKGPAPSQEAVIKFLDKHPRPTDEQFHEWAEGAGYNVHKAEQVAYRVLSDIVNTGRSKGKMPPGTPVKEIRQGVKVEKEHTPNPTIARKVVADHITETGPGYYPALLKMERRLEKKAAFFRGLLDELEKQAARRKKSWLQKHWKKLVIGGLITAGGVATAAGMRAINKETRERLGILDKIQKGRADINRGWRDLERKDVVNPPKIAKPVPLMRKKGMDKEAGPPTLAKLRRAYPKGKVKPAADPQAMKKRLPEFPKAATVSGRMKYLLKRLAAPIRRIMAEHKGSKALEKGQMRKALRYGGVSAGLGPSFGREPKKAKKLIKSLEAATSKA